MSVSTDNPTVRRLVQRVDQLEAEVETLRAEKETLEQQVTDLEQEVEDAHGYAEAAHRRTDTVQTGLTELQVRELQSGAMLSDAGLDTYAVEGDLGLDLDHTGDGDQCVRLSSETGDEQAAERAVPDAAEMCKLEQHRQMLRRGLIDPADIGDTDLRRATWVWDAIDKLAEDGSRDTDEWVISSEKVRRVLTDHVDAKDDSFYQITKRVMRAMAEYSGGLLATEVRHGTRYVYGDKERIQDGIFPLYEAREYDGANIVVSR